MIVFQIICLIAVIVIYPKIHSFHKRTGASIERRLSVHKNHNNQHRRAGE